jgi:hypothetical protein
VEESKVIFSNFAKSHRKFLPRVFEIWGRFVEQGVADIAENLLIRMASKEPLSSNFMKTFERRYKEMVRRIREAKPTRAPLYTPANILQARFFDLDDLEYVKLVGKDRERWFKALRKDHKMSKPFIQALMTANSTDIMRILYREGILYRLGEDAQFAGQIAELEKELRNAIKRQTA